MKGIGRRSAAVLQRYPSVVPGQVLMGFSAHSVAGCMGQLTLKPGAQA